MTALSNYIQQRSTSILQPILSLPCKRRCSALSSYIQQRSTSILQPTPHMTTTMTMTPMTTNCNYDYDYDYHDDPPLAPISHTLSHSLALAHLFSQCPFSQRLSTTSCVVIFFFCSFLLISHSRSHILLHSRILSHLHSRLTVGPVLIVIEALDESGRIESG